MENTSGLKPLGRAVLIRPYEPERKASVIAIPDSVQQRAAMVNTRAVIVAVGPTAWFDEPSARAAPGDKVFVTAYAGFMATGTKDGEQYRLVNDGDVFCQIAEES